MTPLKLEAEGKIPLYQGNKLHFSIDTDKIKQHVDPMHCQMSSLVIFTGVRHGNWPGHGQGDIQGNNGWHGYQGVLPPV